MLERYTAAFERLKVGLRREAKKNNIKALRLYIDAAKCYIRYGVTPNEYLGWRFFELSHFERSKFYTARHSNKWETRFNNPEFADNFNQKQLTNRVFHDFIHRDWIYTRDCSEKTIKEFLEKHHKVIVKPVGLSSGRGIHVANNEDINNLIINEYLLEEFIVQHKDMAALNSSSVNSVRVYTLSLRTDKGQKLNGTDVLFLSASIRVGGAGAEVDNYHAGGVGYPIDIQTGTVCAAGTTISGEKVLYHPGSGTKVIGFEIPHWKELKDYVIALDHVIPQARLIAWDIAVLENGFELIEANYNGDPGFMQAPTQTGMKNEIINNY